VRIIQLSESKQSRDLLSLVESELKGEIQQDRHDTVLSGSKF
jgi:hypothetical protein